MGVVPANPKSTQALSQKARRDFQLQFKKKKQISYSQGQGSVAHISTVQGPGNHNSKYMAIKCLFPFIFDGILESRGERGYSRNMV